MLPTSLTNDHLPTEDPHNRKSYSLRGISKQLCNNGESQVQGRVDAWLINVKAIQPEQLG